MHFFSRYLRNLVKFSATLGSNFQIINNRGVGGGGGGGAIIPDSRVGRMFFLRKLILLAGILIHFRVGSAEALMLDTQRCLSICHSLRKGENLT